MVPAEARPRLREPGLVGGVELLVVVAQGGVGDLHPRLRVGRHRDAPLRSVRLGRARGRRAAVTGSQCSDSPRRFPTRTTAASRARRRPRGATAAIASGRPPARPAAASTVGEAVLAGQHEDAPQTRPAGPPGRPDRMSSPTIAISAWRSGPPATRRRARRPAPRRRRGRTTARACRGSGPDARSRTRGPATKAPGVERRAVRRSATSGLRCIPISSAPRPDEPERAVEVVVGERLGRVADDHGGRAAPGASASSAVEQALAVELGQGVGRGQDEERPRRGRRRPGVGGGRRQRADDPLGRDRRPEPRRPARRGRPG